MNRINLVALVFLVFLSASAVNSQTNGVTKKSLAQIKRIYIENKNIKAPELTDLSSFLRIELTKQGFIIVDTNDKADATLSGEAELEITLDGDSNNPPDQAIYKYHFLSLDKFVFWKIKIKFAVKSDRIETDKIAAQRIINALVNKIRKSIRDDSK